MCWCPRFYLSLASQNSSHNSTFQKFKPLVLLYTSVPLSGGYAKV